MIARLATFVAFCFIASLARAADPEPLHLHFMSGAEEYASESSLTILQNHLEAAHQYEITGSWVADRATDLPGIENIARADVLVVYARRLNLPEEQMAVVRAHWQAGKPVVGIRTASHAFQEADNKHFDGEVLGGSYQGHYKDEPVSVAAAESGTDHPVLEGVGDITSSRLYKTGKLGAAAIVLQTGVINADEDTRQPVTWVNTYKGGRMFYTSLGVQSDFEDPDFLRLITNAISWVSFK